MADILTLQIIIRETCLVFNLCKASRIHFDVARIQESQPIMQSLSTFVLSCHISVLRPEIILWLLKQQPFQTVPGLPRSPDTAKGMFEKLIFVCYLLLFFGK